MISIVRQFSHRGMCEELLSCTVPDGLPFRLQGTTKALVECSVANDYLFCPNPFESHFIYIARERENFNRKVNSSGRFFTMAGEFGGDAMTWDRQFAEVSQITILDPFVELTVFFWIIQLSKFGYRASVDRAKRTHFAQSKLRTSPVDNSLAPQFCLC